MDTSLPVRLLTALDIAVLEQTGARTFNILGEAPYWCGRLYRDVKIDGKTLTIEDELSFLGNFVIDAVEFWSKQEAGRILWSEVWEETLDSGDAATFEAGAIHLDGRNILLVRLLGHVAVAGREMVQKAKERLLSFEDLFRTEKDIEKYKDYLEKEVQTRTVQVRKAEEKYHRLFDTTTDAFVAIDTAGKIIEFNKAFRQMVGYSDAELNKISYLALTPEKWHALESKIVEEQVNKRGYSDIYEKEYRRKDGVVFPVELRTFLLTDEAGGPTGMWAIVRDITGRKRIEEALKTSEERYRLLVENANEAIVVAQDDMLKFANPKTAELSGYSIEELMSIPFADIIHTDDQDMVMEQYLRGLKGEVLPTFEFRISDKAGNIKWAEISSVSIVWEGKPAMLNLLTDITERKKAEQQALVNTNLASIGELVAGVAHEINNPLTGIIGYAQLLTDRKGIPQDVSDDLQKIYEESKRTVKIVQNLLRFARQYKPERTLVDINELLERTLELETYKLRTSNIELYTKMAAGLPFISADYNQLQQVVLNIMNNAQQAIAEMKHKGKITVNTAADSDCVKISISDNGPGISPQNVDRIFDPFFTTKPAGSGSGLGLSVCHGIITEHGGNIYVESALGKGTTFSIELPIAESAPAVTEEKPQKKTRRQPGQKRKGSLLIVEDEPAIRSMLTRILSADGYRVQAVSDGKAALSKLIKGTYQLLLVDLKMPGMGGRELYETMKKKHPASVKNIIFITGDMMTADTHDFLASTGRPYLIKPFDSEDITGILEKALLETKGK